MRIRNNFKAPWRHFGKFVANLIPSCIGTFQGPRLCWGPLVAVLSFMCNASVIWEWPWHFASFSEYLLHDNFLEPMAGEILPLPSGTSLDPKRGHGSLQRPPNLRGHPHSQVYSEFFTQRRPSTFKSSGNHNSTFAGDNITPPLPQSGGPVATGVPQGQAEGSRSLHFHGQPHPGSILNPSELQHSCTHSFVPSQPATSMAQPRERRGSSEVSKRKENEGMMTMRMRMMMIIVMIEVCAKMVSSSCGQHGFFWGCLVWENLGMDAW